MGAFSINKFLIHADIIYSLTNSLIRTWMQKFQGFIHFRFISLQIWGQWDRPLIPTRNKVLESEQDLDAVLGTLTTSRLIIAPTSLRCRLRYDVVRWLHLCIHWTEASFMMGSAKPEHWVIAFIINCSCKLHSFHLWILPDIPFFQHIFYPQKHEIAHTLIVIQGTVIHIRSVHYPESKFPYSLNVITWSTCTVYDSHTFKCGVESIVILTQQSSRFIHLYSPTLA